jgi:hypothetical protein
MKFESKRGHNEEKCKNNVLQLKEHIFFTALFWLVPWLCIAKMSCTA